MAEANQTEQATPRRRQKAREKGQVARSRDLIGAASGMAAVFVLFALLSSFPLAWRGFFRDCLEFSMKTAPSPAICAWMRCLRSGATPDSSSPWARRWPWMGGRALFRAGAGRPGLRSHLARAQPFTHEPGGQARPTVFDYRAARTDKSLLPAAVVAYVSVGCLRRDWPLLMALPGRSAHAMLGFAGSRVFEVAWKSALVLLLWSVLDYFFERQHLSSELKMSRQEMKDEYKETEGNPIIKGRIRRLQRQVRRRRMLADTKRAAVVITNPTAYAVALEYRPDLPAPIVVAKGRNLLAAQIKEIARWENIPMVENKPLAHALYRTVEVGQSIPANSIPSCRNSGGRLPRRGSRRAAAAAAEKRGRR